jgi:protein gp37
MADRSAIEWTDATWNVLRGCLRVSPGCQRCYAERDALRMSGPGGAYEGLVKMVGGEPRWTGEVRFVPELLDQPLRWRKPRRIFVNSMSDLFHEKVEDEWLDSIFAAMALAPQHVYQILTKRPERMQRYVTALLDGQRYACDRATEIRKSLVGGLMVGMANRALPGSEHRKAAPPYDPWPFVWPGVSVEDRKHLDRLDWLRDTPAAVRFVSFEPLLEDLGSVNLDGIHQVILGGESGPGARPCDVAWIRSLRDQAKAAGCKVFVKQFGARPYVHDERGEITLRDRKGADPTEWPEDLRIREWPAGAGRGRGAQGGAE